MNEIDWQGESVKSCKLLLENLHMHFRFGNYDTVDVMLYNINLDASPLMFIGMLRYTVNVYKHSMRLPSWPIARDKVYAELRRRGESKKQVKRELEGLMDI